ncbi:fibronectin type III domain-containing protein [Flammeovirga aprica]|uniref:T9SS type A sorting domain-containing protein n=1 Tax=Flammeovirga aprica JL-4 TaxID=694437 RepID=A0A7X9P4B8_9BACT|nr:fibronectin type III domain-containing protein [Flammeovirga aprica]NME68757.1 T9SS type A sorting domain-containing protein [Flammeovirga aprica JL-4]
MKNLSKIVTLLMWCNLFLLCPTLKGATVSEIKKVQLTAEEQKLYQLINEYRNENGLPDIPLSKSLTYVAQRHVWDLETNFEFGGSCNMHSWSDKGEDWSGCCYIEPQCMWDKPSEMTPYPGYGYEISYGGSGNYKATAEGALQAWKGSSGHNTVIVNQGSWKNIKWNSVGIGIYESFAVVWFGAEVDPVQDDTKILPEKPTALSASNIFFDAFDLSWANSKDADSYEIQRMESTNWIDAGTAVLPTFAFNNLDSGSVQEVRVRAVNADGTSDWSNSLFVDLLQIEDSIPNIPTNLLASGIDTTSFTFEWKAVVNAESYTIQILKGGIWTDLGSTANNSYKVENLLAGSNQKVRVKAVNSFGTSEWSSSLSVDLLQIDDFLPAVPTDLIATEVDTTSFTFKWNAIVNADFYTIQVLDLGIWVDLDSTVNNNYKVENRISGSKQTVRVKAVNNFGASDWSDSLSVDLLKVENFPPAIPTDLIATEIDTTSFIFQWKAVVNADSYIIQILDLGIWIDLDSTVNNNYKIVSYIPGGKETVRVKAVNKFGSSDWSDSLAVNLLKVENFPPAIPTDLIATEVDTTSFTFEWKAVVNAESYTIQILDSGVWFDLDSTAFNTFKVENRVPGSKQTVRVKAVNKFGSSDWSDSLSVDLQQTVQLPDVPTDLVAVNITETAFELQWAKAKLATAYQIDRLVDSLWILEGYSSSNTYLLANLDSGSTQSVRVKSINNDGESDWSTPLVVQLKETVINLPDTPTNLKANNITSSSFDITWSLVDSAQYEIQILKDSTWVLQGSTASNSYLLTNMKAGSVQQVRVRAVNNDGASEWSSILIVPLLDEVVSIPNTPSNLTATAVTNNSMTIVWNVVGNATSYDLQIWRNSTWQLISSSADTSVVINDLASGSTQYVRVRATNKTGSSSYSDYISVKLEQSGAIPSIPRNLKAYNVNSTYFGIYWATVDNAEYYDIQRWNGRNWVLDGSTNSYYYYVEDMPYRSTQYVRIRSRNRFGASEYTQYITVSLGRSNGRTSQHFEEPVESLTEISVYPNPASNTIRVKNLQVEEVVKVQLISSSGIVQQTIENLGPLDAIDVSRYNKGIYILKVYYKNNSTSFVRFVKQ